jgi:HEPN domain-containing protein
MVEKYLKAILDQLGRPIQRTHDLGKLLAEITPFYASMAKLKRGVEFLTDFAVDARYPGGTMRKRQADAALRWAERVRAECRTLLGIKPPRRRKRK